MLKFVADHFMTRKMCRNTLKKLPSIIIYVPDQYNTQNMCIQIILENDGMLRFIPDCCKNAKMWDKADDDYYSHALEFLPDCYKIKKNI